MEVKRVPQSGVGQAVDPATPSSHQEHQATDKRKKNPKKGQPDTSSAQPPSQPPQADWEDAQLSHQPVDTEKVAELLNQASHNPTSLAPVVGAYKPQKPAPKQISKLNQKY